MSILPFDTAVVWAYGDWRATLERRGTPIGSLDTMIAAHAINQHAGICQDVRSVVGELGRSI